MNEIYPYLLSPSYKDYIWGGSRIPKLYQRQLPDGIYAESWEVSDRKEGPSTITNGPLKGLTLDQAIAKHGTSITGSSSHGKRLPLLIKLIDAADNLSVQVHPHDSNAHVTGGEPKTEMWYVIDADKDAKIYAGLKKGTSQADFRAAIASNSLESLLNTFNPQKGQVFFIPGGRVHAIGAGCLLLEVQQNSNTTYRVYDWGRVDARGQARPLHIEEAMKVINWNDTENPIREPLIRSDAQSAKICSLLDSEWFALARIELYEEHKIESNGSSFRALFIESGSVIIRTPDGETVCARGQSCLVPASLETWTLAPQSSDTSVLAASV